MTEPRNDASFPGAGGGASTGIGAGAGTDDRGRIDGTGGPASTDADFPPVDPWRAAVSGACPRCARASVYDGLLRLRPRCTACGLELARLDPGDGAAVFVILIVNVLVVGLALYTEITYAPSVFVHVFLFGPMAIVLTLALLRIIKALLIALQFKHNAHPGTLDRG